MRLVQKKHTELPYIADIDPNGPAAHTDIKVGDILLQVNGIDARASHEELKTALGTTDAAALKLRRAPKSTRPHGSSSFSGEPSLQAKILCGTRRCDATSQSWMACCSTRDVSTA